MSMMTAKLGEGTHVISVASDGPYGLLERVSTFNVFPYSRSGYGGEARAWQAHDAAGESKDDGGAAVDDDEDVEICRNRKRHQQLHIHLQKGSLDFGAVSVARFHGKFTRTVRRNIYRRHEVNVAFPFFCRNVL